MCIKKETKWHPECCFHSNSLVPVSFCQKTKKIPICNLYGGTKGLTWNRNSSHIVFSLIIRLGGVHVDGSCWKKKREIWFLLTQCQQQNCCHGNSTKGVIWFLVASSFSTRPRSLPRPALLSDLPHWPRAWNRLITKSFWSPIDDFWILLGDYRLVIDWPIPIDAN